VIELSLTVQVRVLASLGLVLPAPPTPLGAYVESSDAGNLLFLSGMLPVVDRKLPISARLGENLSVKEGQDEPVEINRSR
jgi:enamine deaminase RidA (YjgF/YER057c/UK114 family)